VMSSSRHVTRCRASDTGPSGGVRSVVTRPGLRHDPHVTLSVSRKLLYSLVPVVLLVVGLELLARTVLGFVPPEGSRGGQFRDFIRLQMPREDMDKLLRFDPDLFWRLQPNTPDLQIRTDTGLFQDVATNSMGLRDDEITALAPGTQRLLCLGDSTTYGSGVVRAEAWPEVLARELGAPVDVVNAGVPGYTAFQCARWLEREGLALEPDIVLVTAGFNDARSWDGRSDEDQAAAMQSEMSGLRGLINSSRAVQLVRETWRALAGESNIDPTLVERSDPRLSPARYRYWLGRIADAATGAGARVAFILWPIGANLARPGDPGWTDHQRALRDFCAERQLLLIDPLDALVPLGDGVHITPAGNAAVAGVVATTLHDAGWVDAPTPPPR
jgi:lysophospholipase L1-like esterase